MSTTPRPILPYGYSLSDTEKGGYLKGPENRTPWICVHPQPDGGYRIQSNSDERIPDSVRMITFPTAEHAAAVGLAICREHDRSMKQYAAPKPLLDAIDRAEHIVDGLEQKARGLAFEVAAAKHIVNSLRKAAGLPENEWRKDDLIERLNTFTLCAADRKKWMQHPFFTEAILYDLLGKEDARSVLGLIAEVKRHIDPVGGAI